MGLRRLASARGAVLSFNRYARQKDLNQPEIVTALKRAGCAVWPLERPLDLLVWRAATGKYYLIEVKNPDGFNRLTKEQKKFRDEWPGPWHIVRSAEDALWVVGAVSSG